MESLIIYMIIFIMSIAITLFLDIGSLESLYISLVSLIVSSMVITYLISFSASVIIVSVISVIMLISSLVYSYRKKLVMERLVSYINSPAFWLVILATGIFMLFTKGVKLVSWDAYNHWARAPKAILKYNGFIMPRTIIFGRHPVGTSVLYAWANYFSGMREDLALCSMNFVYWLLLMLPFAKFNYKKTVVVALFAIISFSALSYIPKAYFSLYADTMLGLVFFSSVTYYYINKHSKVRLFIVILSIVFSSVIKDEAGIIVSVFIGLIIIYDMFYKHEYKFNKPIAIYSLLCVASILLTKLLNNAIYKQHSTINSGSYLDIYYKVSTVNGQFFGGNTSWCDPVGSFLAAVSNPVSCILIIVTICLIVAVFYTVKKKNKILISSIIAAILLGLSIFIFVNLDSGTHILIKEYVFGLINLKFFGLELPKIIIIISGVYFLLLKYVYNKKKKYLLGLTLLITLQSLFFAFAVMYSYSAIEINIIHTANSMERYIGIYVLFVVFSFIAILMVEFDANDRINYKDIYYVSLMILITMLIYPEPLYYYNTKHELYTLYNESYFAEYETYTNAIEQKICEEDKFAIIIDKVNTDGGNYVKSIFTYYTLTPLDHVVLLSTCEDIDIQIAAMNEFFKKNETTKVFVLGSSGYFDDTFRDVFESNELSKNKLFDVVWNEDSFILKEAK